MKEPSIKKPILSWRRILIKFFGSPVMYIPNETPAPDQSGMGMSIHRTTL